MSKDITKPMWQLLFVEKQMVHFSKMLICLIVLIEIV